MFSICIPNFNYERYLGLTLDSVLSQDHRDLEVLIADNASTDGSVELVRSYQARDSRIKLRVNRCNVGFAGNLSRAASMATGDWMTMLSSDDLMRPGALTIYARLIEALGDSAGSTILSSGMDVIDSDGKRIDGRSLLRKQWAGATRNEELSAVAGADVWVIPADRLLGNSIRVMRSPFYFATTTYPRAIHDALEGYSQGGLMNPDKRFAWALLGKADQALFVDAPLFSYRVHNSNQNALQARSGALKHITDEYITSFATDDELLRKAQLTREQFADAFVEQDVALRGLLALADGNRVLARRILKFGQAAYPDRIARNRKAIALRGLLTLGVVGSKLAAMIKKRAMKSWTDRIVSEAVGG